LRHAANKVSQKSEDLIMSTEGSAQKGQLITLNDDGTLTVPDNPMVVCIEGDGIGPDISRAAVKVFAKCSILRWQRHMEASEKFNGRRRWLEKKLLQKPVSGCRNKPYRICANA
jgi:hypothetical protein